MPLEPSVDLFTGMILGGMLRRQAIPNLIHYSSADYVENCVEIFVRGIRSLPIENTPIHRDQKDETKLRD